jgi:MFS family permease
MGTIVPVLIGLAADRIGVRPSLALALVPAAASIWWLRLVPETRRSAPTAAGLGTGKVLRLTRPSPWAGLRFALSPAGRGALLMGSIWWLTIFQFAITGPARPLYILDRFGSSWSELGVVATVGALGSVVGPIIGGRIADRVGYARLMVVCLMISGLIGMAIPSATSPLGYALLLMLANLIGWIPAPCWGAISAASAPREVRGSVGGLFAALRALGGAVGGAAVGFLYARWIAGPLYVFAATDLLMAGLVAWAKAKGWAGFATEGWE